MAQEVLVAMDTTPPIKGTQSYTLTDGGDFDCFLVLGRVFGFTDKSLHILREWQLIAIIMSHSLFHCS